MLSARELEDLDMGARERVTDVHLPHVAGLPAELPPLFAAAALASCQIQFLSKFLLQMLKVEMVAASQQPPTPLHKERLPNGFSSTWTSLYVLRPGL